MPRFVKQPVEIEAREYDGSNATELIKWINESGYEHGAYVTSAGGTFVIATLEGEHEAKPGDWIIKGVKGEFYPVKPDIFEATYRPLED